MPIEPAAIMAGFERAASGWRRLSNQMATPRHNKPNPKISTAHSCIPRRCTGAIAWLPGAGGSLTAKRVQRHQKAVGVNVSRLYP
jgi:hypothetical protein